MKKILAQNRKAFHHYEILDTFEAGMVLSGGEVKSIRSGKISLKEGWVSIKNCEAFLHQVHIHLYHHSGIWNAHDETRPRKLLLHRRELRKLQGKVQEKGFSVLPIRVYLKGGWIKIEIALARGKKLYDKRATERAKDAQQKIARALKQRR